MLFYGAPSLFKKPYFIYMLHQVWISAIGLCGATLLGSLLGFFIKELPHKWTDTVLGYCAGIMLAASTIGLIVPAFESRGETMPFWVIVLGVMLGAFFLNIIDFVTPHLHTITGLDSEEHHNNASINRVMLFVLAIAIHKLPEGIAAGVSMNCQEATSWGVTLGIAFHNIPEGMIIIAPLLLAGVTPARTFFISLTIGLLEVIGVLLGWWLGTISHALLPVMLGFAGGAMLYVTSDEMIPETHAHGYQKQATYALLLGFISMLLMEDL